jgi:anti-anti-sigma factor
MSELKTASITSEGFSAVPTRASDSVVVKLSGNCDLESTPLLERFLDELHADVRRIGTRAVVIDCHDLYFMNSSSVKYFVSWLAKVRDLEPEQRYSVKFLTNDKLSWQRRSLEAIRRFASEVVSIG